MILLHFGLKEPCCLSVTCFHQLAILCVCMYVSTSEARSMHATFVMWLELCLGSPHTLFVICTMESFSHTRDREQLNRSSHQWTSDRSHHFHDLLHSLELLSVADVELDPCC